MDKKELIAAIAERSGLSKKDAEKALDGFIGAVTDSLRKNKDVRLTGFGTFKTTLRAARKGRNPQTGETMMIDARKAPKFTAGKGLKDAVNA